MLKDAKARAAAELSGPSQAKQHVVEGKTGEEVTLRAADLPPLAVLVVRGCEGCTFSLAPDIALYEALRAEFAQRLRAAGINAEGGKARGRG